VCGDQVALYNEMLDEFANSNAQVLGISVDGAWCHLAFAKDRNLHFPLLSDFEPKGEVSKKYGAYHDDLGESSRALFVLDASGVIRWTHLSPDGVNPGANGILNALEALTPEQRGTAAAGRSS
jgi:peroxiredoxin